MYLGSIMWILGLSFSVTRHIMLQLIQLMCPTSIIVMGSCKWYDCTLCYISCSLSHSLLHQKSAFQMWLHDEKVVCFWDPSAEVKSKCWVFLLQKYGCLIYISSAWENSDVSHFSHKWLVSVCNIHNDIMNGTNQNQSLEKSELRYYFIRLTI